MNRDDMEARGIHRRPSVAVIEAVAEREGVAVTELPPLYDVVDPDALDEVLTHWTDRAPQLDGHIRFRYCGYTVDIDADGRISVER